MSSLIPHPEADRLRERIAALRRELADLFAERVALSFEILPALRHRYDELFGEMERGIQERTLEMSQRKRMVELFALKLDRGQKLDARMVELVMKAVQNEFGRIRSGMRGAFDEERAPRRRSGGHTAPDTTTAASPRQHADEARDLYRRLARRLHPDRLGAHDELTRAYWDLAQTGYMRGDLQLLRTLAHLVDEVGSGGGASLVTLTNEESRLQEALRAERERIRALKDGEPYTIRDGLADEAWIAARRAALEEERASIEGEIEKCNRFLDPILAKVKETGAPDEVQSVWSNFVETMYFNR